MPYFRPSCVINFRIKFDEALTLGGAGPLDSVAARVAKPPVGNGALTPDPLILTAGSASYSGVTLRIPKSCSIEKPGYRTASRFSATFDFRDLPIDPRTVRAAAAEIYLGTISDQDFAGGFRGGGGRPSSVLTPSDANLQLVCVLDEWSVEHSGTGSIVKMSGRDLRGILIDVPVSAGLKGADQQFLDGLDLSQDIQQVVLQILKWNPYFEQVQVVVNPQDWPKGVIPSPGAEDLVPRHQKGARGKKKGGKATVPSSTQGDSLNFWDVIVRVCYLVGGIPYFQGNKLCIRPAMTVFDKLRGPIDPVANPTPFIGGQPRRFDELSKTAITPELRSRKLVFGRDVETMRFHRKFAGWRKPKVVRTIGLDQNKADGTNVGKIVVGIWPPEFDDRLKKAQDPKVTSRSPGNEKASTEVLTIPVSGVIDLERLTTIARSIYEELGRGEMGGMVATKNLASFGGGNADPDLLKLEPGDGVELLVDTRAVGIGAPLVNTYTDYERDAFEEQVKKIAERLGDENLARVIVATARGQVNELQRFFRVQNVNLEFDADSGVQINFDYENYVTVRAQRGETSPAAGVALAVSTPTKQPGNPSPTSTPPGSSLRSLNGR